VLEYFWRKITKWSVLCFLPIQKDLPVETSEVVLGDERRTPDDVKQALSLRQSGGGRQLESIL
jgi:hypothetical protein